MMMGHVMPTPHPLIGWDRSQEVATRLQTPADSRDSRAIVFDMLDDIESDGQISVIGRGGQMVRQETAKDFLPALLLRMMPGGVIGLYGDDLPEAREHTQIAPGAAAHFQQMRSVRQGQLLDLIS